MRNRTTDQITLVLLRHGMTQGNEQHRYVGKTDEELSEAGRRQLRAMQQQIGYPALELLFCSPMKRCLQTAALLYPEQAPLVIPEWEEIDFGIFEGKSYEELRTDVHYQAWLASGGSLPFPSGESREAFCARCAAGFVRMRKMLAQMDAFWQTKPRVGLLVHGGVIMALLSQYGGGDYFDYQVENGRGYVCALAQGDAAPVLRVCMKL